MKPADLIKSARKLAHTAKKKPLQSNLCRAVSTTYYALFHALAQCCADTLIGSTGAERSMPAWLQVYRSFDHGVAKNACTGKKTIEKFPQDIQDFANLFVTMQEKRHAADYDPSTRLLKSAVENDIAAAELAISTLRTVPIKHRRAFAAWVIFRPPRG